MPEAAALNNAIVAPSGRTCADEPDHHREERADRPAGVVAEALSGALVHSCREELVMNGPIGGNFISKMMLSGIPKKQQNCIVHRDQHVDQKP